MISINCEKCENFIPTIENESLDLIVTSPPYNVNLGENKYRKIGYDLYNDNKDHKDYISWLKSIFFSVYSKMKSGGRIAIVIGDGKNGAIPTHSDIISFMTKDLGYIPFSTIIWNKNHTSNRAAWGSYMKPSCPSFPSTFEYILIFSKDSRKLIETGNSDLTKEEFIEYTKSIWEIKPETGKIDHPAVFPIEIPYRLIKMLSWKKSVIFDPFMGSGTTGVASKITERSFIGCDISKEYCEIAKGRINGCF